MPIKPENLKLYPKFWKWLSYGIRFGRADGGCECSGECGELHQLREMLKKVKNCSEAHGYPAIWTNRKVKVILTVAHLDHNPRNSDPKNLKAMCQRCHLRYDRPHHAKNSARTRDLKKGPRLSGMEENEPTKLQR